MYMFDDVDQLRGSIIERYSGLSKRLQQVAKYVIDNQNDFAIETVAVIAEDSGVPPSAVIRFAKEFGFDGASSMQRLFREQLIANRTTSSYKERVRRSRQTKGANGYADESATFAKFLDASSSSLRGLDDRVLFEKIRQIAHGIRAADCVFIGGVRRSYPVAAFFSYALSKAGKRNIIIDRLGGFGGDQINTVTPRDFLLLTSFNPYGAETQKAAEIGRSKGAQIGLITDSEVSPLVTESSIQIFVQDPEFFGFRSLSSTLTIAQAIVVEYVSIEDARN